MLALCESKKLGLFFLRSDLYAPVFLRRLRFILPRVFLRVDLYRPGVSKGAEKSAAKSDKHYALQFSTFV